MRASFPGADRALLLRGNHEFRGIHESGFRDASINKVRREEEKCSYPEEWYDKLLQIFGGSLHIDGIRHELKHMPQF